ncbi:uncharacterized protein [Amphiura filiformis]|uniref:uncharacterized protein isoform X2 n=1 Tax=Amphiura filiformis TaxID=82378 RepID=UPI003B215D34
MEDNKRAKKLCIKAEDASNIKPPEVLKEGATDKGIEEPANSQPMALFQNTDREFFGRTVANISSKSHMQKKNAKYKPNPKQESVVKDLCTQKTYDQEDYYSDLTRNLHGIQKGVWQHVSRQDWIDVIEEYQSKMHNMYEATSVQYKQIHNYYTNYQFVKELKAEISAKLTEESSIPHQWELLCQVGMEKFIHTSRGAMVNWICYVCMRDCNNYQSYSYHMKVSQHHDNIAKAGTTIGNMFLIKYLQQQHLVTTPVSPQHREDSEEGTVIHSESMITAMNDGVQNNAADVRKAGFCERCMKHYEGSRNQHCKSEEHKVTRGKKAPKCELCNFHFQNVDMLRHHMSRQYHKNQLQKQKQKTEAENTEVTQV